MKKVFVFCAFLTLSFACGGEAPDNGNGSADNSGLQFSNAQPLDNTGKPIPGIPDPANANLSNRPPGATPTPGIPEANKADITNQKGATPTPGIPDEATRKRMIEQINKNPNAVNEAPDVKPDRSKTTPQGPLSRPRKSQP